MSDDKTNNTKPEDEKAKTDAPTSVSPKPVRKLSEDQNKELNFFISAPLRSANRLMEKLYSDDHFYETVTYAWVGENDAKKLFLYGVCKEVLKACIGLMGDKEVLQETPTENPDRMGKIVYGAITDAQTYRIRKLIELLSFLILFERNTKRDEEYRVFLSAENLDLVLSRQDDFRELYEKRIISNTQHSINDFADRIERDLKTLGVSELWFLDPRKVEGLRNQKPSIFKGRKGIYLAALMVASPDERLALGISYGRGYSRTSQSIHPLLGSHDYDGKENNAEHVVANFSYLSIIAMHIMHLAYKIAGEDDPEGITTFMGKGFEKSHAVKNISKLKKDFEPGDLVLTAWTDLAEIIEAHTSKYGYKAYKIRYISRPPLPEFPEDWIEAQNILARLMTKSMVRPFFEKNTSRHNMPKEVAEIWPEVMKQPDEELMKSVTHFFADMHRIGVLIPMLLESRFLKRDNVPSFFDKSVPSKPPPS